MPIPIILLLFFIILLLFLHIKEIQTIKLIDKPLR